MMMTVPLYFQVTQRMSSSAAGSHLLPAVIGNAVGGIMAGILIRKLVDDLHALDSHFEETCLTKSS